MHIRQQLTIGRNLWKSLARWLVVESRVTIHFYSSLFYPSWLADYEF